MFVVFGLSRDEKLNLDARGLHWKNIRTSTSS
jgi:hypothetical protein